MIKFFGGTDAGLVRSTNQDRYEFHILSETLGFAVLCDGLGGENGGGVASDITIRFVCDMLQRDLRENMTELSLRSVMEAAMAGANALVFDAAAKDEALEGMGSTLIIAIFSGLDLYIMYVGDSRVYTATPTQERLITKDHTMVQMLVDIGKLTPDDAESHPQRHFITRAVGAAATIDGDFIVHTLAPDELTLLCSDGMYHYLTDGTLYALLHQSVREQNTDHLIALAKEGGGGDNITVVVAAGQQPRGEE